LNSGQQKAAFHGCLLLLHKNCQCVQKLLYKSKVLNREARKEIAKDAKKTYECSGLFGKTLEGGKILKRSGRREYRGGGAVAFARIGARLPACRKA
jgi:hypothetical protein